MMKLKSLLYTVAKNKQRKQKQTELVHEIAKCVTFYKKLYTPNEDTHNQITTEFFPSDHDTTLQEDEKETCKGLITEKECLEALKTMKEGKTPGSDGLPAEFYKIFWTDISTTLVNVLKYAYETGQLSLTQRRGIIKLIKLTAKLQPNLSRIE